MDAILERDCFGQETATKEEITMTHFDTARINEMLGLQIGAIRDIALKLDENNLEQLEKDLVAMEDSIKDIRSMVEGLPHRHQT